MVGIFNRTGDTGVVIKRIISHDFRKDVDKNSSCISTVRPWVHDESTFIRTRVRKSDGHIFGICSGLYPLNRELPQVLVDVCFLKTFIQKGDGFVAAGVDQKLLRPHNFIFYNICYDIGLTGSYIKLEITTCRAQQNTVSVFTDTDTDYKLTLHIWRPRNGARGGVDCDGGSASHRGSRGVIGTQKKDR